MSAANIQIKELTELPLSPPSGYVDEVLTWASLLRLLDLPANFALVAREGESWIGHIVCQAAAEHGEILTLHVNNIYRRQGLGKQLVDAALARCKLSGVSNVVLEVRNSNMGARKLYEQCGGELISHRKEYYLATAERPAEDAAVYQFEIK